MVTPSTLPNCVETKRSAHVEDFLFAKINNVEKKACSFFMWTWLVELFMGGIRNSRDGFREAFCEGCAPQVVRLCVSSIFIY
jgi:hypothetical protein